MARFVVTRVAGRATVAFDDGGMNLLSSATLRELGDVVRGLHDCALVVFTSARPALFAAGADMAEMAAFTPWEAMEFAALGQEVFASIERLPCVTVASIDGDCFGGALDLALSFDLRFATPRSRFSHPGAKLGIVTGFGGTSRWRKAMSRPAANQLFLANRVVTAGEARELGLIDRVAGDHDEELTRLSSLDRERTQLVKELTIRAGRLSRAELLLIADRRTTF